jgi:hypothetical protein
VVTQQVLAAWILTGCWPSQNISVTMPLSAPAIAWKEMDLKVLLVFQAFRDYHSNNYRHFALSLTTCL